MTTRIDDVSRLGLVMVDLQNDFLHPRGAYGRAGCTAASIAALPARIAPLARTMRERGAWIVATHFTLVPGRNGEPFMSPHLKALRPFLGRGDFVPGSWGHALVDELAPADLAVEKVAFSGFYMTRLEWVLREAGIKTLAFCGIVTNGGVAATLRDAHVRGFELVLLEDGCAAFSDELHRASIVSLGSVAEVMSCARLETLIRGG